MTDAHGIARVQLKSIVERVERLEAEIADLNADKSDIYKDARSNGFDVKAIKKVVSRRKLDDNKRVEEDAVFETYWDAIHGTGLVHAHARENIEKFDAETGEVLDDINPRLAKQIVDGMQTEAGRAALIAAVDIMIAREEADEETHQRPSTNDEPSPEAGPQAEASPAGTGAGTLADREGRSNGEAVSTDLPTNSPSDDDAIAAVNGSAGLANVVDVEPSSSVISRSEAMDALIEASADELFPEIDPNEDRSEDQSLGGGMSSVGANTGGDHVTAPQYAAIHQAGASFKAPPAKPLRPNCLRPENCAGFGSSHCYSCGKAAKADEVAA